jgi:lariat debranching enzyme
MPTKEEMDFVWQKFDGDLLVPQNFTQTVAAFDPSSQNDCSNDSRYSCTKQPSAQINSQTTRFCDRLGIDDPMALLLNSSKESCFDSNEVRNILILPYIQNFHPSLLFPVFYHHGIYVDL